MPNKLYNLSLGSTHCLQAFILLAVHKSGLRAELWMSPLCFKMFSSGWQSHRVARYSCLSRHVPVPLNLLQPTDSHAILHVLPPWVITLLSPSPLPCRSSQTPSSCSQEPSLFPYVNHPPALTTGCLNWIIYHLLCAYAKLHHVEYHLKWR